MELRGRHILLISPEPWEGLHMSKHHFAQALAERGNTVYFCGPPQNDVRGLLRIAGQAPLYHVHYRHWFRGVKRWPWLERYYHAGLVRHIERLAAHRMDLIWCFDTSRLQAFPGNGRKGVLHLVDLDILYEGDRLMRSADVVLTTTGPIAERVRKAAPDVPVHQVGHALHGPWLEGIDGCAEPKGHAPRSVAFAGAMATHYVDWWALRTMAEEHPGLRFDLYGPYDPDFPDPDFAALRTLPNARFHGLLRKGELVPALRQADVLLLCYRSDQLLEQLAYPHKMLEYLSTGNPLVCSRTLAFDAHTDLVEMAATREAIVDVLRRTLADHARLDTREARAARIAFARERTTAHLLDRIEALIP